MVRRLIIKVTNLKVVKYECYNSFKYALSDLLKATGYDCPSELQGLTFAEATVVPKTLISQPKQ